VRHLTRATTLLAEADEAAPVIRQLAPGEEFWMLDDTRGWAWGYAGPERRVGYVRAEAVGV
jgi:hypothetical protein